PRDPGLDLAAASAPSRCSALRRNSVAQRQRGQGHKQTATAALLASATGRRTPATGIVRNTLALERDYALPAQHRAKVRNTQPSVRAPCSQVAELMPLRNEALHASIPLSRLSRPRLNTNQPLS